MYIMYAKILAMCCYMYVRIIKTPVLSLNGTVCLNSLVYNVYTPAVPNIA